jgi:predicted CoA-binding protein
MKRILSEAKVIAVVGYSPNPSRTSYNIANFLKRVGYTVIPVNPTVDEIEGVKSYPSVQAIPQTVDIVDVFRRSEHLMDVVEDAIAAGAPVVWSQLGVVDQAAARRAEDAGLDMVMDRCIKVEYVRLCQPKRSE